MNAVIYARVSTEQQAERELSIPAQLKAAREYADRQGWSVVEEFVEPGVSARTAQRPILQAMLKRCREKPKIDVVLVHKIDRLARSVYDHALIRYQLQQQTIKLASVVENVDDSISGQLVENIMAAIAEFYSGNLGLEVKKGMRMLVEKGGWPHAPPRGYRIVRDELGKGHLEIDQEDGDRIKHAFERYGTGLVPLHNLRIELAEMGFTTSLGNPIALGAIHRMLQNPFYAGRVRWQGLERPGIHPAIVSEELFLRVQKTLRHRHRETGEKGRLHFLLRGVAVCASCGAKMTAERHGRWSYYRCVNHTITRDLCASKFSGVELTHSSLQLLLGRLRLLPELKDRLDIAAERELSNAIQSRNKQQKSLRMKKVKLEERETRITEAYANGDVSLKAYRAATQSIRSQLVSLDAALTEVNSDPTLQLEKVRHVLKFADSLKALAGSIVSESQSQLLGLVFKRIEVEESEIVGYVLHSPFDRLLVESNGKGKVAGDFEDIQVTPTNETTKKPQ